MVMAAFVALGIVPTTLLVTATGLAFGPILGPVYAMVGSLTAASVAFALGRRLGFKRVDRMGGHRVLKLTRKLKRNGILAVFIIRKVPAPFALVNMAVGASSIRYRDFIAGSFLGLLAMVIGLAGFGSQVISALRDPSLKTLSIAAVFVAVPFVVAFVINRAVRARHAE